MKTVEPSDYSSFWTESLAQELLRFLTGRLRCSETAADLTHETYLRLIQRTSDTPPDNARALAYKIAINLAIDYQRKVNVRKRHASDQEFDSVVESTPNNTAPPEHILIAQQRLDVLKKALAELPLDCRTAFTLHGTDGLTYSEIADHMGLSKSMVNRLLSRAMTHCRQKLNEHE